jgi:hypothetical protein
VSPSVSEQASQRAGSGGVVPPPEHRWQPGQSGNPKGRPRRDPATAKALTRRKRALTVDAMAKMIERHATSDDPAVLKEWRATVELMLQYSDGAPGEANIPTELDEKRAAQEEELPAPPELPGAEEAA